MGNRRHFISENPEDINYGNLLYASHSVYEGEWPSISHSHYFSEIFFITGGKGVFGIKNTSIDIKENDLIIINPNVNHYEISQNEIPLEYYVLGVENISFDFDKMSLETYSLVNFKSIKDNTIHNLENLFTELDKKSEYYLNKVELLYQLIFFDLLRLTKHKTSVIKPKQVLNECSQTKLYIDSNFSNKISLDTLAKKAHLNKYYLSHAFTDAYGVSPINYLIKVRIKASKDLLASTDLSIAEIAQTCGFSSQSYFSQSFKKDVSITPAMYRKKHKEKFK